MGAEGEEVVIGLCSVNGIIENRAAYPCEVAAYLMAEAAFKLYGKKTASVICNVVNNINNFGAVIAAVIFRNEGRFPALAVVVCYRADLFSAGAEGAEKTFYGGACQLRGNGKPKSAGRGREGCGGSGCIEFLANRAVFFDEVSLLLLSQ